MKRFLMRGIAAGLLCMMILAAGISSAGAAACSMEMTGAKAPVALTIGENYEIAGTVTTTHTIESVKIGVCDTKGNWISGHYSIKKPKDKKQYDISRAQSKMHFDTLAKGTYYYKVTVTDVKKHVKTVKSKKFTVANAFRYVDLVCPSLVVEGKDYPVYGLICGVHKITKMYAGIYSTSGTWIQKVTVKPGAKSTKLSAINETLDFRKLKAGTYYFKVYCFDGYGNAKTVIKKKFSVKKAFTAEDIAAPQEIVKGDRFLTSGTVKSLFPISKLRVGIYSDVTKDWVEVGTYYPEEKNYDLRIADKAIHFGKLDYGTYYYRVYGYDTDGNSGVIVMRKFAVSKPFTVEESNSPSVLKTGSDFTLKGSIRSVYPMTKVKIGVWNASTEKWVKYKVRKPETKEYDIAGINKDFNFGTLSAGTYYYKVECTDEKDNQSRVIYKKFKVYDPTCSISEDKSYPSVLLKGKGFLLRGTVSSTLGIDYVRVGICNSSKEWISDHNVKKSLEGAKSFSIFSIDSDITFGNLPTGTYYYRVYVKDTHGIGQYLIARKFKIISPYEVDSELTAGSLSEKDYAKINDADVFIKQISGGGGCTVCASTMMARRMAILCGKKESTWSLATETSMKADPSVWVRGTGLQYNPVILGLSISKKSISALSLANKQKKLISLLESNPEGIAVYYSYGNGNHCVLLTDYVDGVFKAVDPVTGTKVTLKKTWPAADSQDTRISQINEYWYIKR